MKQILLGLSFLAVSFGIMADSKIDVNGLQMLNVARVEQQANGLSTLSVNGEETVKVLVRLAEGATFEDFADYDIDCTIGDKFALIDIALSKVEELAALDAVAKVSFGSYATPSLDKAVVNAGVDVVHAGGDGLPQAFDGSGVVAGMYDTGVDPNHVAFRTGDFTTTRVKRFWSNGVEYTDANVGNTTTDSGSETHGTHVAGIMAGIGGMSGTYGNTRVSQITGGVTAIKTTGAIPFEGVAPGADLALCGGSLADNSILAGVTKIINYAKSVGKPVAINLSLGLVTGPHDGMGETNLALDELGNDALIFLAAGNDADLKKSLKKTFTASDNTLRTFIRPTRASLSGISSQFWSSDNSALNVQLGIFQKSTGVLVSTIAVNNNGSNTITGSGYNDPSYIHDTAFSQAFTSDSYVIVTRGVSNGRSYASFYFRVTANSSTNNNNDLVCAIIVSGSAGRTVLGTATEEFSDLGLSGYTDGDTSETISDFACGKNIITVGAYAARSTFVSLKPSILYYPGIEENNIANFSSYGTTFDGRNLPNICTPGHSIISAYSRFYYAANGMTESTNEICAKADANGNTNYWGIMSGTSMACPFATGVGVLMLQADPTLTRDEVVSILTETATKDSYVQAGNPIQWGAGKVNALEAVKKVLGMGGVGSVYADEDLRLIVNDNGGKQLNVFLAGVNSFTANVYDLAGGLAKTVVADGNETTIDASSLANGIYVLEVRADNAHFTRKIALK